MSVGLLFGCDKQVAAGLFAKFRHKPHTFDRAIGLVEDTKIIGVIMLSTGGMDSTLRSATMVRTP